jgi:hypothetical protein
MKAEIAIRLATMDKLALRAASAETTERAIWFLNDSVVD